MLRLRPHCEPAPPAFATRAVIGTDTGTDTGTETETDANTGGGEHKGEGEDGYEDEDKDDEDEDEEEGVVDEGGSVQYVRADAAELHAAAARAAAARADLAAVEHALQVHLQALVDEVLEAGDELLGGHAPPAHVTLEGSSRVRVGRRRSWCCAQSLRRGGLE